MIPALIRDTGLLPCGRHAATLDDVAQRFVDGTEFSESSTRRALWSEWECHRFSVGRFSVGSLIGFPPRAWISGSFITAKRNPRDVDVFYAFDPEAYDELDPEDFVDLTDLTTREWCVRQGMRVDAYMTRQPDHLPVDELRPALLGDTNLRAFQALGLYDEIWQRAKMAAANGTGAHPSARMQIRRGYLEVQL